jgi:serine/threonine protein kinase
VNTETDERVAIKVLDKEKIQKQNMGAQIKKEISIMKMVRHKHVVVLKEVLASRTKVRSPNALREGGLTGTQTERLTRCARRSSSCWSSSRAASCLTRS